MDKLSRTEEHNGKIAPMTMETSQDVEKAAKTLQIKILGPTFLQRRTLLEKYLLLLVALLFILCIIFMVIALSQTSVETETISEVCLSDHCVQTAASLLSAIDSSVDPCDDFFQFACGTWNNKHIIPEDKSSVSTFEVLSDDLQKTLKRLLEEPLDSMDNPAIIKAKTLYQSCTNTSRIEEVGDKPLRQALNYLGNWPVTDQNWLSKSWSLEELLGKMRGIYDEPVIIEQWVGPDDMNSSVNIIQLDQASLGLPSRDYFLKGASNKDVQAYHRLMTEIAVLLNADPAYADTEMYKVMHFEIRLANATTPEGDRHDTGAIYKKMKLKELQQEVPEFNWLKYLQTFILDEITEEEPVVVYALSYFKQMGKIIAETRREIVTNYAIWHFVLNILPQMGSDYQEKRAQFRKVLYGVSAQRMRWNHCVDYVNEKLGMAVGSLFIRDNFNHESKVVALEMILNIRTAFNELLDENNWMDDQTRKVAKEKANAMNERIGYPELLTNDEELSKEYEGMVVLDHEFLESVFNIGRFQTTKILKKLRQPVNKDKWNTDPAIVNAFYDPNKNDIVFPAGILQPLFYSKNFPKSLNYGGIGVVIGHEITHGFDDKGRQFDKDGNLKQWWNNATIKAFRERTQCIIDQYSSYTLEEVGLQVNGKMTQGENIADNGGLKQAFRAYHKWVKDNGEEALLPGINLTHNQLFFLNYAQIWCGSMRPEDAINKIRASVHSPGPIRVLGPLSNSNDFAEAYKCAVGSRMNPVKKCSVW